MVSDAHQGLRDAITTVFTGDSWQRCRTHFMTNLLTRVPRRAQPWLASMVRTILQQPYPEEGHTQLERMIAQQQESFPQTASLLDAARPDILAFSSFPAPTGRRSGPTIPKSDSTKENAGAPTVVGIFSNQPAIRRLVRAVLAEQHDEWAIGRRYITLAPTNLNEAFQEAQLTKAAT